MQVFHCAGFGWFHCSGVPLYRGSTVLMSGGARLFYSTFLTVNLLLDEEIILDEDAPPEMICIEKASLSGQDIVVRIEIIGATGELCTYTIAAQIYFKGCHHT